MILSTSNITFIVRINIDDFLINDNIGNSKNACRSKQKDYDLAVERQKMIEKSVRDALA